MLRCYLSPSPPPPLLRPFPFSHTIRAGALIMRGFRRSRFHSFLRLRHREMIIGTWPMWSVHTRNETTSRWYPPEVHADLPPRTSETRGARSGPLRAGRGGGSRPGRGGKAAERGPQGARAARVDSRYTAAASVSAMSARSDFYNAPCTLPHSRSLTPSHPPPRRGAEDPRERGERPRAFHEATSEANASERTNLRGTSDRAPARSGSFWQSETLFDDLSATFITIALLPWKRIMMNDRSVESDRFADE